MKARPGGGGYAIAYQDTHNGFARDDQARADAAVYVDVFTSYHELAGEAHCGSNTIYTPYDMPWWQR